MYFKNIIDAVGHTPLIELQRTSPSQKVKIMVKLEGQNPGGSASIKDRVAKYMIEKAEQSGALTRDKTIVEATSGNTGIALAWLGRQKGYKVTIVMPDSMSMERRQLLRFHGAELILTKGALGMGAAIAKASEMAEKDKKYFMPDQFSNPANPLAHYETTAVEILDDFPYDKIDVLVAGIGTGGTIIGIARRLREKYPNIKVIGAEPPPGDEIQGLKCLGEALPPFWDKALITERARVSSQQAAGATTQLLKKEGIFTGLSSGAVAHQAVKAAAEIGEGNIVAILADAGWKYLSLDFWNK
ncbi:MAG: cysteine synthase family protein [Chloroflexi bacterium]|jgi:cysteine synthase B|nr:cysteine synthase family protein [Chloroflexota bacterium]